MMTDCILIINHIMRKLKLRSIVCVALFACVSVTGGYAFERGEDHSKGVGFRRGVYLGETVNVLLDKDVKGSAWSENMPTPPPTIFLTTNLLYDAALIPNVGVGVNFGHRFTMCADWMYAWWSNSGHHRYWRIYGGDVEMRMQLGEGKSVSKISGHYVGVYAGMYTYDFQFGNHKGVMGGKFNYTVGVSYGYSLPVSRRLNLDFSIGVGYMWGRCKKHHPVDDHDVWLSNKRIRWMGPNRVGIGLTWLIGKDNVNTRKGGAR